MCGVQCISAAWCTSLWRTIYALTSRIVSVTHCFSHTLVSCILSFLTKLKLGCITKPSKHAWIFFLPRLLHQSHREINKIVKNAVSHKVREESISQCIPLSKSAPKVNGLWFSAILHPSFVEIRSLVILLTNQTNHSTNQSRNKLSIQPTNKQIKQTNQPRNQLTKRPTN